MKPELTYKTNDDGLIELSVDGKLLAEWSYEDEPEDVFGEFERIFWAGYIASHED